MYKTQPVSLRYWYRAASSEVESHGTMVVFTGLRKAIKGYFSAICSGKSKRAIHWCWGCHTVFRACRFDQEINKQINSVETRKLYFPCGKINLLSRA